MKSQIDKLLEKLKKNAVDNDLEFLKCFIDLDDRLKEIENYLNLKNIERGYKNGKKKFCKK
jgi:hypothetical protein